MGGFGKLRVIGLLFMMRVLLVGLKGKLGLVG